MVDTLTATGPVLGATLMIPKALLRDHEIERVRRELTFVQFGSRQFGSRDTYFLAYDDRGDWISVPRAYGMSLMRNLDSLKTVRCLNRLSMGEPVAFAFNEEKQKQKPRHKLAQDRIVRSVVERFKSGCIGGVVVAPCGTGKTVAALKIVAEVGLTTLVLVHKEFLVTQWMDRIEEFLGIPRNDVGIVQQGRVDYQGRKIVLAMVQSLVEREYEPSLYTWPGLVIADETHRHGADMWHRAVMRFSSQYRLGLTATPSRRDGVWVVVTANFGNVIAREYGEAMSPTIYVVRYSPGLSVQSYCWVASAGFGEYRVKRALFGRFLNVLVKHGGRNALIVQVVTKAFNEGRKVLILTDRLNHVGLLQRALVEATGGKATVGRYVGGMSEAARSISESCDIIVGTYHMAQEGLDIPDLDVGVLATPHANVEQPIGRICRHLEGKKRPIIIDIADDEPFLAVPFFNKRNRLYQKRGWPVRFIGS